MRDNVRHMARRKPDHEKGPIGAWATKQRDRRGWMPADVVRALDEIGHPITEGTYRGIEAGPRAPSLVLIRALERVFEAQAPDPREAPPESTDLAALVTAMQDQTAALTAQTAMMGELVAALQGIVPLASDESIDRVIVDKIKNVLEPVIAGQADLARAGARQRTDE